MLSYRNYKTYEYSQVDDINAADDFSAASYQRYQGEKLRKDLRQMRIIHFQNRWILIM